MKPLATHCLNGHLRSPENLKANRSCKQCSRDQEKARARGREPKPPKTHCKSGHPRTPENLTKSGGCKECRREADQREWKAGAPTRQAQQASKKAERKQPWIDAKTGQAVSACRKQTLMEAGWTQQMVDTTAFEQGDRCAICRQVPQIPKNTIGHPGLCADHKHSKPPEPRGLLCNGCNALIGFAKENPETCRAAAEYLEAWA